MKNITYFLLLFAAIVTAQTVTIPDANFKLYLTQVACVDTNADGTFDADVDLNNDGEVQVSEALAVTKLQLNGTNNLNITLSNVNGIEAFTNLNILACSNSPFTTLDISALIGLTRLSVVFTQISSINVSALVNLTSLTVGFNPALTSLDVSHQVNLTALACNDNGLTSLDVSHNTLLTNLQCSVNQLTSLDISNLINLQEIDCGNNLLTTFDASNNPVLLLLEIANSPNLAYVNVKNGLALGSPFTSNCPNLMYVCEDELNISSTLSAVSNANPGNDIQVTSYCSFTPGGDYNTIRGSAIYDVAADGCASDFPFPYMKVNINDGTNSGSTFTNESGGYSFYTQAGSFTIAPAFENLDWFDGGQAVVNFPTADNLIQEEDFCILANGVHPDVEIVFTPTTVARPGLFANYKMVYRNKGNQPVSGTITVNYDSNLLTLGNSVPNFNIGEEGLLTWVYSNLSPFETRIIDCQFNVNDSTNAGDVLHYTATINPIPGDETPSDNISSHDQTIVNSADPNEILCIEGNTITTEEVGGYLHYNINFENIGTADAINIVVKDMIDAAKFDMSSLQLQYASHEVSTRISGNTVEFIFKNIYLPPVNGPIGGHGNVLFKIKTLPTLVVHDEVMQSADIYFDYNAAVPTNEARTVIAGLSNSIFIKDESITIAPNPARNYIVVGAKNKIKSIDLFDVQGRLLQTVLDHKNSVTLDISKHANGIYFLKVITEKGSNVARIVKVD